MLKRKEKIAPPDPLPPPPPPSLVEIHVEKALDGLSTEASTYDKAAALNAYIHLYVKRVSGSTAKTVDDVLEAGEAICGGMSLALIKMLEHIGLKADYAFTYGGLAAHSMVEVLFNDEVHGLFDPYHGVAFYSTDEQRPLSIFDIERCSNADPAPVFYVRRSVCPSTPLTRANVYTSEDEDGRMDFSFPEIFTSANGVGLANSGFVSFINIQLSPGDVMGDETWSSPSASAPRPWTTLSGQRRSTGEYVSWAYQLGQTALGYNIIHVYTLFDLIPGQQYSLQLRIANIYTQSGVSDRSMALTMHPVSPFGKSQFFPLREQGYREEQDYIPKVIELIVTAETESIVINGNANGDLVLQSIALKIAE